jgi:hypothetical protein
LVPTNNTSSSDNSAEQQHKASQRPLCYVINSTCRWLLLYQRAMYLLCISTYIYSAVFCAHIPFSLIVFAVPLVPSYFSTRSGYRAFGANGRASAQLAVVLTPSHRQTSVHLRQKEAPCSFLFCSSLILRAEAEFRALSHMWGIFEHAYAEVFPSLVDDAWWVVKIRGGDEIFTRSQAYCRGFPFYCRHSFYMFPAAFYSFSFASPSTFKPLTELLLWISNTLIIRASSIRLGG